MDLQSSLALRSPLARLNSNQQRRRDRNEIDTLFSPERGRATRATTRKIRKLIEAGEENKTASCTSSATSSGGDDIDSRTDGVENQICVARKPKTKKETKISVPSKKTKSKPKKRTSIGRWEPWEKLEFLRGLRRHGRGHWKKIGESIPTRSTVQVKTHAQVMMKKHEQGINIFEELDNYETIYEVIDETFNGERKEEFQGCDENLHSSSFPLPRTMNKEQKTSNTCRLEDACGSSNQSQQLGGYHSDLGHSHTFVPIKAESEFKKPSVTVPTLFQPLTSTSVTTTMVRNPNSRHPFEYQSHHHYDTNQHTFHPYQYTPSFDAISTAASTAASVAASSALFPTSDVSFGRQNSAFQVPMVAKASQGSNLAREFLWSSQSAESHGTNLLDPEREAVEALLHMRDASENGSINI